MRPQYYEPCNICKHWNDKSGCDLDRYNSTSMVIFGHCGFCKPKATERTTKAND